MAGFYMIQRVVFYQAPTYPHTHSFKNLFGHVVD
jgi:hypothetical protein